MSVTVYHPGRYGDLIWALPTIRALTKQRGEKATLVLPTDPANTTPMDVLVPLLQEQVYLDAVIVDGSWSITQDAPRAPRMPETAGLEGLSLGYTQWPTTSLPYETALLGGIDVATLDDEHFFRPWVQMPSCANSMSLQRRSSFDPEGRWIRQHYGEPADLLRTEMSEIAVHWTDRYFELKLGILAEIARCLPKVRVRWYAQEGSRMCQAGAKAVDLATLAYVFQQHDIVLTDCSCAHVLAAAVGVERVLVVEPEEARHHFIFWPGSEVREDGHWVPRTTRLGRTIVPVLGGDFRPTFDSRATIDMISWALTARGRDSSLC